MYLVKSSRTVFSRRSYTRILSPLRSLSNSTRASSDPYPLPLSSPELNALASRSPNLTQDDNLPWPEPLKRQGEDEKTLRARLVYQTRKRGMLEGDLLLSTFARDQLGFMTLDELREFDQANEPDWDIYYWSIGKKQPPERWATTSLLEKLRKHAKNEGKVVRVMPDL
ncbi:hypothetical protein TREMEDRAFT_25355 [Tremella mesenterica DSM 1558]|uniref:uncharacterized protein n=1 Tax=Tremella mesenterica (strain ATCC 24925 / CBS 8224 / DSM 1558 / NBRC 9311 / NRRL Y-6157 / RJB 2259-6 / UBC 559-6) TaxID=578456 RepID=UPI0003F4A325|nr:uncharacterized protein TREMEDRAFT_25355 [Tremella mesenterica DSM 1558]EIW73127.1 hypothetical protein TREMEDRAFT_25355 [Tremella mesenterica DSM 1558]